MEEIKLTEIKNTKVFALVYGASGTGKTDLCGTLGSLGRTLIIDIDQGSMTLKTSPRVKPYHANLVVVSFDVFADLDTAYKLIQKNEPSEWNKAFGTVEQQVVKEPFEWIVWDSWSELQWNMMQELRRAQGLDKGPFKLDYRQNVQIQHWGMLTDLNKLSIEALRSLPINQVFIMLEALVKDEISGQVTGGPAIHGKLVSELPGYFNIVVRTYTNVSGDYCCTTKSKGRFPAKTRLGVGIDKANCTVKELFTI